MHQTKISKALRSLVFVAASAACASSFAAEPSVLEIAMADGYATEATQSWRIYDAYLNDADRLALTWSYDELISSTPTAAGYTEVIRVAGYPDAAVIP